MKLVAATLIVLLCHCILPPPVTVEDTRNSRPEVNYRVTKPNKAELVLNLNCKYCTFSVYAEDPDINDTLYAQAYFNLANNPELRDICQITPSAPNESGARNPLECQVEPPKLFPTATDEKTTHALEMWISDRPFSQFDDPITHGIEDGAGLTIVRWTIRGEFRGACDDPEGLKCRLTP